MKAAIPKDGQTTMRLPTAMRAWLAWEAAHQNRNQKDLVYDALRDYHKKRTKLNPKTPGIEED